MTKFIRTYAGKTVLFCLCILFAAMTVASVCGAIVMFEEEYYTTTPEQLREHVLQGEEWKRGCAFGADYLQKAGIAEEVLIDSDMYNYDSLDNVLETDYPCRIVNNKTNRVFYESATLAKAAQSDEYTYNTYLFGVKHEGTLVRIAYGIDTKDYDESYTVTVYRNNNAPLTDKEETMLRAAELLFSLRYWIYAIGLAALLLTIFCFIALLCAAGRRNGTDDIKLTPLKILPVDVMTAAVVGGIIGIGVFGFLLLDHLDNRNSVPFLFGVVIAGMFVPSASLLLGLCMTVAARIKAHCLLRTTLIYYVIRIFWKILKVIGRVVRSFLNWLPMIWKTVLAISVLSLAEMIGLLVLDDTAFRLTAWFLEKLVLVPLVIYLVISLRKLQKGGEALARGDLNATVNTNGLILDLKKHGENLNSVSVGMAHAVNDRLKSERMKTELITNVSHDLKTPLTSVVNYAGLIQNEPTDNEKIKEYSAVLVRQSEKLKRLIEDLVEASKAATGNLDVALVPCDAGVFVSQAAGEYEERLQAAGLTLVTELPDEALRINADSRRMWRVFDNLMNNACKYAQSGTRVFLSLYRVGNEATFTFKNTSREELNISTEELTERFVRGDSSRGTDGNGLGLSIAKSLTELQGGRLTLAIDGDLFKATLHFPLI